MDSNTQFLTSLMIIVPHPVQEIAVPLLKQYAPNHLMRYPANIPVLYPFVVPESLSGACTRLREVCATIEPIDITVSGYGRFPKLSYMSIANADLLQAMFAKIQAAFPNVKPYGGDLGPQPYPHIIVADFNSEAKQRATDLPHYVPYTFRAHRLHVMYGPIKPALPWIAYDIIPLGPTPAV
jgi:2'-5' RNA ligase